MYVIYGGKMKIINFSFHLKSHLLFVVEDSNTIHCSMAACEHLTSAPSNLTFYAAHLDNFSFIFMLYYLRDKEQKESFSSVKLSKVFALKFPRNRAGIKAYARYMCLPSLSPMLFPKAISKYAKETKINDQSYVAVSAVNSKSVYARNAFSPFTEKANFPRPFFRGCHNIRLDKVTWEKVECRKPRTS